MMVVLAAVVMVCRSFAVALGVTGMKVVSGFIWVCMPSASIRVCTGHSLHPPRERRAFCQLGDADEPCHAPKKRLRSRNIVLLTQLTATLPRVLVCHRNNGTGVRVVVEAPPQGAGLAV